MTCTVAQRGPGGTGRSMSTGDQSARRPQGGFAYVLLLLAIALISIAATGAVSLGATMARRDAERELLAVGTEFRQALLSYAGVPAGASLSGDGRGPKSLDDLLKDPRVPGVRRHMRRLYPDPLTGKAEWGLLLDVHGRITGVHSLAEGTPIQQAGFEPPFASFEGAESYRQWVFGLAVAQPHFRHSQR
jgi:type II secretory pathway pseudopilin PulG